MDQFEFPQTSAPQTPIPCSLLKELQVLWQKSARTFLLKGRPPPPEECTAQHQFIEFCLNDCDGDDTVAVLPTAKQTLIRFSSHLANRLYHTSIKV